MRQKKKDKWELEMTATCQPPKGCVGFCVMLGFSVFFFNALWGSLLLREPHSGGGMRATHGR
jgi:hypothetical protein